MVRCKFRVVEKAEVECFSGDGARRFNIKLKPVQSDGFGKYTPSGAMEFTCENNEASEQLVVGKEYFVDLTLAE